MTALALRFAVQSTAARGPEETLLFATAAIVLLTTLVVFVWQYLRNNRKD